ncbi:MAG: SurA N-terminal domain-containing protein, partial [Candidatus Omnitrophica bacterium]|nr:SurA N-terminal domain-containing protein [Candidatus Omnitrophota bacterium]
MLKTIRKKGVIKKLLWAVAISIILSFGIFSQIYLLEERGQGDYAGKIFDKKISLREFQRELQFIQLQARMQYGVEFQRLLESLDLTSQTWDRLILLHEAQKRNIKIPDQEIIQMIEKSQAFQRKGRFDRLLYEDLLQHLGINPRDFEEGFRNSLKITKLYEQETSDIALSDEDIFQEYRKQHEKIQVSYILFPVEDFKNQVTFDEAQAKDYYEKNKNQFMMPPSVNV